MSAERGGVRAARVATLQCVGESITERIKLDEAREAERVVAWVVIGGKVVERVHIIAPVRVGTPRV